MAATATGHGCTITFDGGYFAKIENIEWSGVERGAVETTYMGLGAGGQTFIPEGNYNPGELVVTYQFDEASDPPIAEAAENCTLTFQGANTYQASAFMTGFSLSAPDKGVVTATATLKFSGNITF